MEQLLKKLEEYILLLLYIYNWLAFIVASTVY